MWDLATKSLPNVFRPVAHELGTVALSPDGKYLAAGEYRDDGCAISLWDILSRPRQLWSKEMDGHPSPIVLKFSPDGPTLVANAKSFLNETLVAWDLTNQSHRHTGVHGRRDVQPFATFLPNSAAIADTPESARGARDKSGSVFNSQLDDPVHAVDDPAETVRTMPLGRLEPLLLLREPNPNWAFASNLMFSSKC